jgi:hypothetical protein
MAGHIKQMIDAIVEQRARGNSTIALTTKAKLVLKGVDPSAYHEQSFDDPLVEARIRGIASDLGVRLAPRAILTAVSTQPLPQAVSDLRAQCGDRQPGAVIFFASSVYDPEAVSQGLQTAFPCSCVVGCSSVEELTNGRNMTGSIAAMFLDAEIVEDAAAVVLENISLGVCVRDAFSRMEKHFQSPLSSLDVHTHVGLVLVDGLTSAQERLMERIGDATDLLFVGGSSSASQESDSTHVLANGQAYRDSAVLALWRLKNPFEILKTQSFRTTGKTLVPTAVEENLRRVIEFDHQPAAGAYSAALGLTREEAASQFFRNPLGLMFEGEPFVRSPQMFEGDAMRFFCQIRRDQKLAVLEATDMVNDTRRVIEARRAAGEIRGILEFQCIRRSSQLHEEGRMDEYGAIFSGIPRIGFSTFGEEYLGHLNQTSTMLLLR